MTNQANSSNVQQSVVTSRQFLMPSTIPNVYDKDYQRNISQSYYAPLAREDVQEISHISSDMRIKIATNGVALLNSDGSFSRIILETDTRRAHVIKYVLEQLVTSEDEDYGKNLNWKEIFDTFSTPLSIEPIDESELKQLDEAVNAEIAAETLGLKMICKYEARESRLFDREYNDEWMDANFDDDFELEVSDVHPLKTPTTPTTLDEKAQCFLDSYRGNIFFCHDKFYIFDEIIWNAFTMREFDAYVTVTGLPFLHTADEVLGILEIVKQKTFRESFPTYQHPDGSVLVFDGCCFCPAIGEYIKDNDEYYAMNYLSSDYNEYVGVKTEQFEWLNFLNQAFGSDDDGEDKIKLLQEFMGLSLTDITKFGKMMLLVGNGVDGRMVVLNTLQLVIGDDNLSVIPVHDFNRPSALANLQHKLINIDANAITCDNSAVVRAIVTGQSVALAHEDESPFDWNITTKLWASIDGLPEITEQLAQHVISLQFNHIFTDAEQVSELERQLLTEKKAIFEWAVEGLHRLLMNNAFTMPPSSVSLQTV